jgi:hypothetical protein
MGEPQQLRELEQTAGSSMKIVSAAEMREIDRVHLGALRRAFAHADGERGRGGCPLRRSPITRGRSASVSSAAKATTAAMDSSWRASWSKQGRAVRVLLLCDPAELRGDAAAMYQNMLQKLHALNVAPLIVREASGLDSSMRRRSFPPT